MYNTTFLRARGNDCKDSKSYNGGIEKCFRNLTMMHMVNTPGGYYVE